MECGNESRCLNCNEHFKELRPRVSNIMISEHFRKDAPGFDTGSIMECKAQHFTRLHKFEEKIDGNWVFRAVIDGVHIVYAIDRQYRLIFLRSFNNFKEYKKYLNNKKLILDQINNF